MTHKEFLQQFGHLIEAPNGIQKLREMILRLAVQGKLVEHDPNDEHASLLLDEINKEETKLVAKGEIKARKHLPPVKKETNQVIPRGWIYEPLGNLILEDTGGGTPSKQVASYWGGDIPWASVKDIGKTKYLTKTIDYISQEGLDNSSSNLIPKGRIILCTRMGLGKLSINDVDVAINQDLRALHVPTCVNIDYLYNFFLTQDIQGSGMTVKGIKRSDLLNMLCPLPPLAEQHRIVAKVDELMGLCDQLEAERNAHEATHQRLIRAVHHPLTEAVDAGATQTAWHRIRENFADLYNTLESVQALRQTILQLAVQGKLVPQDPNDEPASELLDRVIDKKARLIKNKEIKKQKDLPVITENETPWELPAGWEWVKFGLLAEFINGDRSKNYPNRNEYVDDGIAWINTGHIEPTGYLTTSGMNYITKDKFDTLRSGKIKAGDLVYCLRGATFGKTAFVEPYTEGAIASSLMIIRSYIKEMNGYIFKYLVSPLGRSQIFRFDNGSAQPNLSANSVMLYAFPMPPLTEQHRIVTKVDELMALCDQLEANIREKNDTATRYAEAIVQQIAAA